MSKDLQQIETGFPTAECRYRQQTSEKYSHDSSLTSFTDEGKSIYIATKPFQHVLCPVLLLFKIYFY